MPLPERFTAWIHAGEPKTYLPERDLSVPGALKSVEWNKLVTHARGLTMKMLQTDMNSAARASLGSKATASDISNWKKVAARHFFFWLEPQFQDEIAPGLGSTLRTGVLSQESAAFLGLAWEQPLQSRSSAATSFPPSVASPSQPPDLTRHHRRKLVDEIVGRVLDETQSLQEIQGILAAVSKRLTPQLETDPCKVCQRVGSACNAFRGTLTGANQDKFDSTVVTAVGKSHQAVRSWGLQISREKWRKATGKDGGATKSRRGRPSKVNDPKVVQKVVECIVAHTQESSIWLKAENCKARTLTCSLQRAYWDGKLASVVAWKQFHTIVRTQCRWAIKPTRRTDFCDHCHLFETCIEPGMVKLTTQVQNALR